MKISEECQKCWNETFDLGARGGFLFIRKIGQNFDFVVGGENE